jgi:group I intron endonuclease
MKVCKSGIYKITNLTDGKFYIGSAVNLEKRFYMHRNQLNLEKHRNSKLQRAWVKYGEFNFAFSVLEEVTDVARLIEVEQNWLDKTKACEVGYNICKVANSRLGVKASPETLQKMSIAATGYKHTPEAKSKISLAKIGKELPVRGEAHRAKISERHKGKAVSEETRLKLSIARKARPPASKETRLKRSASMKVTLAAKKLLIKTKSELNEGVVNE